MDQLLCASADQSVDECLLELILTVSLTTECILFVATEASSCINLLNVLETKYEMQQK
jgi:hypothetical protein